MGAWGVGTFDNDTACDWGYELEEFDDFSLVERALAQVEDNGDEYLDGDLACEALAACEVIARLKGYWGVRNSYTETIDNWVAAHPIIPTPELSKRAVLVIDRVVSPPSEMLEGWLDDSTQIEWLKAVADLRTKLDS